jgi:hypothetical protein
MKKKVTVMVVVALVVAMSFGIFCLVERVYLEHGEDYPIWLASSQRGHINNTELLGMRESVCKDEPIEVIEKSGQVILRCGWAWPFAKTYVAKSFSFVED